MQHARPLESHLVDGLQHFVGAGLGADKDPCKTALLHQLHVFVAGFQQEIRSRLDVPLEFLAGLQKPPSHVDAALTVHEKVVIHDVEHIEAEAAD